MADGFHTLFILVYMALPQTEGIIKPCLSSLDSSPSSPHDSFSLGAFPYPLCSDPPAELQPRAPSDGEQPNHDPASLINSHKHISPAAPSCTLSFPNSRIHAVGIFMSSLLLVSLSVSYFLEIISFMVKPHPVQRPLLPVVVGAWSLLQKMLLFIMDCSELLDKKTESCSHAESERHLEINHKDYQNKPECSSVCKSSSGRSCRWPLCFLSSVFVIQGLLTSLLALINSLVTALVVPQLLHSSGACSVLVYLDPGLSLLAVIMLIVTSLPQVSMSFYFLLLNSADHIS
ncbi:hypothetical protein XENOCAPTIV_012668 [Xenoophorus captivus]|uniref:Uncharacterized protein n=1 Tax=Xenoophorus captivus TaxID=1517983 RepID=A0ABV0RL93_9TELE